MIKSHPELLQIRTQAKDYSGRTIIASPFQAALGAEDTLMWEMMLEHMEPEDVLRQYEQQFPEGIEVESAQILKPIYNNLAQAIIDGEGEAAIATFREMITQPDTITQGKHFNMQHLVAAMQVYVERYDDLGNDDNRKVFWSHVIGYVQRQMPSVFAQAHCTGLKNIYENEDAFKRTFDLQYNSGKPFFPLIGSDFDLGVNFCVYSWTEGAVGCGAEGLRTLLSWGALAKYCETKTGEIGELKERLESGVSCRPK